MMRSGHIFAAMALLLLPLSCRIGELNTDSPDVPAEGIVLDIFCQQPATRAGKDGIRKGEQDWNENLLSTLDVFFYPEGGTGRDCVFHKRYEPGEADGDATVSATTTDTFISSTLAPGSNTSFWVYVIANYPGIIVDDDDNLSGTSVTALKQLPLNTDFSAPADHKQASFVMDGLAQVTGISKTSRLVAKGQVELKRLAAKISVQLNIANQISVERTTIVEDETVTYYETWEPMLAGMQMYLENGVRNTTLSGKPSDSPVYFSYSGNRMNFTKSSDSQYADYPWITDPTYLYPQRWEYASKKSPLIEPTIKLILPWRRLSDGTQAVPITATQKQFYYKIIIPDDPRAATADTTYLRNFVMNNWYLLKLDVGILGSETDEASILVDGHYYVLEWQDKEVVIKHAVIGKARFLSVEPKEYELNNVSDLSMLYTSSHPVALTVSKGSSTLDITATRAYYGTENAGTSYGGGTIRTAAAGNPDYAQGQKYIEYSAAQRAALNGGQDWLSVDGSYIKFYHELNNDMNAGEYFDCSPYIIRYNLYHADHNDDSIYKQSVKIVQYPAMYIENETSNGYTYVNNYTNGQTAQDNNGNSLGSIANRSEINDSGGNTNPRQYTVTVTVLSEDSEYMIGDPRTDGSSAIVTTLTGLNSSANYRPASEEARYIIAPSLRIASSYGKTGDMTYANARARCAAYQENGYPAGRWRLPTMAEVMYLITLSEKEVIPTLFSPDSALSRGGYWCADGVVYPLTNGTIQYLPTAQAASYHNGTNWPRCVYDTWYWGEGKDSNHMTSWGGYQTTK